MGDDSFHDAGRGRSSILPETDEGAGAAGPIINEPSIKTLRFLYMTQ
jgi:hypothetical protein